MKTKQEMQIRSLYMPSAVWNGIDEIAENEDLSANQVIRKIMSSWLLGFLVEKNERESPMRIVRRRERRSPEKDKSQKKERAQEKALHYGR